MTAGLWITRSWMDIMREFIIGKFLFFGGYYAYREKLYSISLLIFTTLVQHLVTLFIDPNGFLPDWIIPPASLFIAFKGIQNSSLLYSFIGIYMTICHFKELDILSIFHGKPIVEEIVKLFYATSVCICIMFDNLVEIYKTFKSSYIPIKKAENII
jgi:hypothetical protein